MLRTVEFIWNHPISRNRRAAALWRYLRWQIGARILRAPVVIPFVEETTLVCERSMTGATGNLYCGLHEFGDMGFLLHFLRPGDLFLDVGANVGSFSVLASGVVGARSVALEPVPSTFRSLQRNIAINGLRERVSPICVAAAAEAGVVRFSTDRDTVNQVVDASYAGGAVDVPTRPLDEVGDLTSLALCKVDVEGFEREVLEGARRTLRIPALRAVLLEGDSPDISDMMRQAGFTRASYEPKGRRLAPANAEDHRRSGRTLNHLWVRDYPFVEHRCRTSRTYTVYGTTF